MNTNLVLNHTLHIYDLQADKFGDAETLGDSVDMSALVEDTQGWENSGVEDTNTGTLLAYISPVDPYFLEKGGKLYGLVVQFSRFETLDDQSWYRVSSVRPGESLVTGEQDLVELTLARILPRDEAGES